MVAGTPRHLPSIVDAWGLHQAWQSGCCVVASRETYWRELEIRLQRAAFNRALAVRSLTPVGPILSPNAILFAGIDSALLS